MSKAILAFLRQLLINFLTIWVIFTIFFFVILIIDMYFRQGSEATFEIILLIGPFIAAIYAGILASVFQIFHPNSRKKIIKHRYLLGSSMACIILVEKVSFHLPFSFPSIVGIIQHEFYPILDTAFCLIVLVSMFSLFERLLIAYASDKK